MVTTRKALKLTFTGPILRRSLMVAVVVGTTINFINQGPELVGGQPLVVWKLLMTWCIPFLNASFGAFSALRSHRE